MIRIRKDTAQLLDRIKAARRIPKIDAVHEGAVLLATTLNASMEQEV